MSSSVLKYRFENVKSKLDSFDYFRSCVTLKPVGVIWRGCCPIHNENTPSFTVYPSGHMTSEGEQEHASYYCYGCGSGGDVFEFRKNYEGLKSTVEALEKFEEELEIEVEEDEAKMTFLKESLQKIKKIKETTLSLSEINLLCSSMCRNYLLYVKENHPLKYKEECDIIEKYYYHIDNSLMEKSALMCMPMIEEIKQKLNTRRSKL